MWICVESHRFPVPSLYSTPLENLRMTSLSLRATSLFPKLSCAWSYNIPPLISAWSAPLWYPGSVLLAPIYFACSNPLFFYHSDLIFSLCDALLDQLRSDMLNILLSDLINLLLSVLFCPFYFIMLQSSLIIPLSSLFFYLLIYDCSAHDPLLLICSVIIARIRAACIVSVWLSSLSSALFFAPLDLLIFLRITYH